MPELIGTQIEDAYRKLELLGFPLTLSMFDLLKIPYRGDIRTDDLIKYIKKKVG